MGNLLDLSSLDPAVVGEVAPEPEGLVRRSLRSGLAGAHGQLRSAAGRIGETLGAKDFAREQYAAGQALANESQALAPETNQWANVHGPLDAAKFAVGNIVSGAPVMAAGLGAAAFTRSPMAGIGAATAATMPFEFGQAVQQQEADPVASVRTLRDRNMAALPTSVLAAGVQNIVPVTMAGRLLSKPAAGAAERSFSGNMGVNMAEAVGGNAVAGGASEAIRLGGQGMLDPNRDTSHDWENIKEGAIVGGVTGLPFGVAGGVADHVKSRANTAVIKGADALAAAKDKGLEVAGMAKEKGLEAVDIAKEKGAEAFDFARGKADDAKEMILEKMAKGPDTPVIDPAKGEDPTAFVNRSDKLATDTAFEVANNFINDTNVSGDVKRRLSELLNKIQDPVARTEIATIALAQKAYKKVGELVQEARDRFRGDEPADNTKQSADFSGVHRAIAERQIYPVLDKIAPHLAENPEIVSGLSETVRRTVQHMMRGGVDPTFISKLRGFLGDKTMAVLQDTARHFADATPAQREAFAKQWTKLYQANAHEVGGSELVRKHLPPELRNSLSNRHMQALAKGLDELHSGEALRGMGVEEAKAHHTRVLDELRAQFGEKNSKALLADWQKRYEEIKERQAIERAGQEDMGDDTGSDAAFTEHSDDAGDPYTVAENTKEVVYGGKGGKPIMSHEAHQATYGPGESQAMRLMLKAREENPDANVYWRNAREHARRNGEDPLAVPPDHGVIVAESLKDNGLSSKEEAQAGVMQPRYKRISDKERETVPPEERTVKGRIDTDNPDVVLDAIALTRERLKSDEVEEVNPKTGEKELRRVPRMEYSETDDLGNNHRVGRAFLEGLAGAMDTLGVKVDESKLPNDLVIQRRKNGKDLTLGDIRKLDWSIPREDAGDARSASESSTPELKRMVDKLTIQLDTIEKDAAKLKKRGAEGDARGEEVLAELREKYVKARDAMKEIQAAVEAREAARALEEYKSGVAPTGNSYVRQSWKNAEVRLDRIADTLDFGKAKPGTEGALLRERQVRENRIAKEPGTAGEGDMGAGLREIDPKGQIHLAAAEHGEGGIPIRTDESGLPIRYARPGDKGTTTAPAGPAKEVAPMTKSDEIKARRQERMANANKPIDRTKSIETIKAGGEAAEKLIRDIGAKEMPNEMRATVKELLNTKPQNEMERANINYAVEKLNGAIGEALKKSLDASYAMMREHARSDERVGAAPITPKEMAALREHVELVLGDHATVAFENIPHAGDYTSAKARKAGEKALIRVSLFAIDPQSVGYHESLHGLMDHLYKANKEVAKVLTDASRSASVMTQLKKLLAKEPDAWKQVLSSSEEAAAYMYQFYVKGKLNLGPETKNIFTKIKEAIMSMLGVWTNDQRAMHIMDTFNEGGLADKLGDKNAVHRALMEEGTNKFIEQAKKGLGPLGRFADAVFGSGAQQLLDTGNPAYEKIVNLLQHRMSGTTEDPGFIPSARTEYTRRMNALAKKIEGIDESALNNALKALQTGTDGATSYEKKVVAAVHDLLATTRQYMKDAGVKVGDLGPKYFPRIWDADYISRHQKEFIAMMEKNADKHGMNAMDIQRTMNKLMARDGSEFGVVVDMPGMQFIKERALKELNPIDVAPFLKPDLMGTLQSYVMQATRRAEWARRFGDDGSKMKALLDSAKKDYGATEAEQLRASEFIRGIDGTLGDHINPTARRWIGNTIVYQNVRLLPLMIFSSMIDPQGIMVRGGEMRDAFNAFKRGIMEIPRGFKDAPKNDAAYDLAETLGVIDRASLVRTLGGLYTQGMVSNTGRTINNHFFKYNLAEQFNTSMRVSATEAAIKFIAKHADGTYSEHSGRWMEELGLKKSDVVVKDGRPLLTANDFIQHGYSRDEAMAASNKMRGAVNQWVDGAILRPNAADKPIWMNDPHYALFAHLKQFTYSFQHTILGRVANEAKHGNLTPVYALASYIPIMLAADLAKGIIQGGGSQPSWKEGWDLSDYLWSAIQRAGLLGVGQYGADFVKDIRHGGVGFTALLGPTVEQGIDAAKTLGGREQFKTFATHALPANALYASILREPATDPQFTE